jgi:cytochrome c oxidase assembly factor CtaG
MGAVPITAALILLGLLYVTGWLRGRKIIPLWRVWIFLCGLILVWLAAASPLAMLDEELLTAHMMQHLLLMTVAPAFLLLGLPTLRLSTNPLLSWFASAATLIAWHFPALFELGLSSMLWHHVEQASFFAAGLLFWLPVFRPQAQWSILIYLFMATLPCDALSAFLAFCGHVVYPHYSSVPRHFMLSALQDQQCAGALMWACVTFAYLIPAALVTIRLLSFAGPSTLPVTPCFPE